MIRKFINFLGIATSVAILASCSGATENLEDNQVETTVTNEAVTTENLDLSLARLKAENCLLTSSEFKPEWEGAKIGECYLWYNPVVGNDTPAYAEFKVTKNGENAGYIMVSLTEMDFEIPEYCTEGKTMYEIMQEKAETTEIKATRYSPFAYMAEDMSISRSSNKKRVFFGTLEYLNNAESSRSANSDFEDFLTSYLEGKTELGGIGGSAEELKEFYANKTQNANNSRGKPKPPYPESKYTYIADSHLLPTYNQYEKDGKFNASGCSPTAAAIVLAYWYRKHGKTKLFDSKPCLTNAARDENEEKVIERLRTLMNTDVNGGTKSYNCWDGLVKYLGEKVCPAWVTRWYWVDHNSDEGKNYWVNTTCDWNAIYDEIKADRPAILHFKNKENDSSGHSVVIRNVTLYYDEWKGVVDNVECEVNYGWGDWYPPKTINASSKVITEVVTCNIW